MKLSDRVRGVATGVWRIVEAQINKPRLKLEEEIRGHHLEMNRCYKPWDIHMAHVDTYHHLQSRYLQKYGRYYKVPDRSADGKDKIRKEDGI